MPVISDRIDDAGNWVQVQRVEGKWTATVSGMKWHNMAQRCTPGGRVQTAQPWYVGCTISFYDFNEFCEWHQRQVGYGEFEVDKDLLVPGNKVYSASTCILLPRVINMTLIRSFRHKTNGLPPGVQKYRDGERYTAWCSESSVPKYLGIFKTPDTAHQAHLEAKRVILRSLADEYKDRLDPRAYEALYAR